MWQTECQEVSKDLFKKKKKKIYPHHLLTSSTTFHALNSIKLCRWPISSAISLGKYLTNACLHVPRGLWLQGTLKDHNSEVSVMRISYSATSLKAQWEEKIIWALTSLCFSVIYHSDFSQNSMLITAYINCLNQTLSMHTDHQDNNLHQWNVSMLSKKQASKRIY